MSNFMEACLGDLADPNNWDKAGAAATGYEEAFKRLSTLIADAAKGIPATPQQISQAIDNPATMHRLLQKVNSETCAAISGGDARPASPDAITAKRVVMPARLLSA